MIAFPLTTSRTPEHLDSALTTILKVPRPWQTYNLTLHLNFRFRSISKIIQTRITTITLACGCLCKALQSYQAVTHTHTHTLNPNFDLNRHCRIRAVVLCVCPVKGCLHCRLPRA